MKRVILTTVATIVGLVALLSFKTHGQAQQNGALPSAALSQSGSSPSTSGATPGAAPDPTSSAQQPSGPSATATTYLGSAEQTRYGVVQVKITVASGHITNVSFAQLTAFDGKSARINNQAAPTLLQETIDAQSAHIDGVSGASYTSQGYEQSLQSALDKAGLR
jgi:uncharacterized protein with FMN-binding domain